MTTNLQIMTTFAGEDSTTNIPNVNPSASNADLKTFAEALIDLTQETYVETTRIDKTQL